MKTDYRFWEHNLNPITMQPADNCLSKINPSGEGDEQLRDERWAKAIRESKKNYRTKKVGKFW
jgi:hypothetical protein